MVVAVDNREARCHYFLRQGGGAIIGYSLKCASTFVHRHSRGVSKMGIVEAHERALRGTPTVLVVRHPLDRMVSNYIFWRGTNRGQIASLCKRSYDKWGFEDELGGKYSTGKKVEFTEKAIVDLTFEEFYELTQKCWNPHWADQTTMHTYNGDLVPNVLYPIESLRLCEAAPVNATKHDRWENYFTTEFREKMEERWWEDVLLYKRAQEQWDGEQPKYF